MTARLPLLLLTAALLVAAVIAARGRSAIPRGEVTPTLPGPRPPEHEPPVGAADRNAFLDIFSGITMGTLLLYVAVMLLIGLAGILAMIGGIGRRRRIRASVPTVVMPETDDAFPGALGHDLVKAARHARLELSRRAGGSPSDAIVAAWLIMEEAAAARGTARAPHQTPTEFTGTVLTEHSVDAAALSALRALYLRARFGPPGQVTSVDAEAAVAALERVETSLVAS